MSAGGGAPAPFLLLLAGVFAAVVLTIVAAATWRRENDKSRQLSGRFDQYRRGAATNKTAGLAGSSLGVAVSRLLSTRVEEKLAGRLQSAGLKRKPAEWVLMCGAGALGLVFLISFMLHSVLIGVVAGGLAGWFGSRTLLTGLITRRRSAFANQLPEVLELVAGSLSSGLTLARSLDTVVRNGMQPAAHEFSRAITEARLGADLEEALEGVATRMDSEDMRWTVMAVHIQRAVGGNLVEVLRNVVSTMRERAYLRRHVHALTAEGRMSAYILIALPIGIAGWLFYASPGYMSPMYTNPLGLVMLIAAGGLVIAGTVWMRRLIRPEV